MTDLVTDVATELHVRGVLCIGPRDGMALLEVVASIDRADLSAVDHTTRDGIKAYRAAIMAVVSISSAQQGMVINKLAALCGKDEQ